jgi:hypothetical protein
MVSTCEERDDSQAEEGEESEPETESEGEGIDLELKVKSLFDTEAAASGSDNDSEYYKEEENSQDRAFIASEEEESCTDESEGEASADSEDEKLPVILKGGLVESTLKRVNKRLKAQPIKKRRIILSDSETDSEDESNKENIAPVQKLNNTPEVAPRIVVNPYIKKVLSADEKAMADKIEKNRLEALKKLAANKARKQAQADAASKPSPEVLLRIERNRLAALERLAIRRQTTS